MAAITAAEYEKVFRELYPRLYYYALDFTDDEDDAKDTVSAVFTSIWTSHRDIGLQKISSYLYTGVRNKCLDLLKHKKRVANVPLDILTTREYTDEIWREREERVMFIESRIAELPQQQQDILIMHYRQNMSYNEIADALGMRYEAVKKQLYRTMKQLRETAKQKTHEMFVHILAFLSLFI